MALGIRLTSTVEWSGPVADLTVDELRDIVNHLEGVGGRAAVHVSLTPGDQREPSWITIEVNKLEA